MRRTLIPALLVAAAAAAAQPARAYWSAGGSGQATANAATLPAGAQPAASGAAQTLTVSWAQRTFRGAPLGGYAAGGYRVRRYPAAGGAPATPAGTCAGVVAGTAATLSCQDTGVPTGSWRYTITPVLAGWTGGEGALGATVVSRPATPSLTAAAPQNPGATETTGAVVVSWSAVAGATGYNVYRRAGSGAYDDAGPLNGATALTSTTLTDAGTGLTGGTTYRYVVRAVAATESLDSNELAATAVARPGVPTGATATPTAGATMRVTWTAASGATGYNVYRRLTTGAYDYAAPLNGATPATGTTYTDTTSANAVTYRYVVRAVGPGAGTTTLESASSAEPAAATADGVAPAQPTTVAVGSGAGPLLAHAECGYASNTHFVNGAGVGAVPVTVTIATPEAGQTVLLSATTPGSTTVTKSVAAAATTVTTALDLSALADGTVTLTARSVDVAGNASASRSPLTPTVRDTVAALTDLVYTDVKGGGADKLDGSSECGAEITASEITGPDPGKAFAAKSVDNDGTFSGYKLDGIKGSGAGTAYAYAITATDLAGNATTVTVSGADVQ